MRIRYPVIGNQSVFPVYLSGIGICDAEASCVRENGLVSHQFLVTLEGSGVLEVDGRSYIQKKGDWFYLASGVPHGYYPENGEWKTAWVVFRGRDISTEMTALGFGRYHVGALQSTELFMSLFDRLYSAAGDSVDGSVRCSVLMYELIMTMRRTLFAREPASVSGRSITGAALKLIDDNFSSDITLCQLAEISGVSVQHFCRCFKAKMGIRPMEYIARRRISEAKRLLLNTDQSISEIAEAVGYSGATYFGMVFRKYEGTSPSEFRRSGVL